MLLQLHKEVPFWMYSGFSNTADRSHSCLHNQEGNLDVSMILQPNKEIPFWMDSEFSNTHDKFHSIPNGLCFTLTHTGVFNQNY